MKKTYVLVLILGIYSCMATLTSCSRNTLDINNNIIMNEQINEKEIEEIDENVKKIGQRRS